MEPRHRAIQWPSRDPTGGPVRTGGRRWAPPQAAPNARAGPAQVALQRPDHPGVRAHDQMIMSYQQ